MVAATILVKLQCWLVLACLAVHRAVIAWILPIQHDFVTLRPSDSRVVGRRNLETRQQWGPTETPSLALRSRCKPLASENAFQEVKSDNDDEGIDLTEDDRLYRVRLSRASGIEWGTDLSFCFVYVRDMDPSGDAARSGQVNVGDQLCEMRAIDGKGQRLPPVNMAGAPFDFVMEQFASLPKTVREYDLVFFHGTRDELKAAATGNARSEPDNITVTVIENKGSDQEKAHTLTAPAGSNIRQLCVDNNINVYQSFTRWTNCKGQQLCGTCIVNNVAGARNMNQKSVDEASTLRENPDSYRLSCVTFAYGDVTIETFPPVQATQWTR